MSDAQVWYAGEIGKIRIASTPGGDALDVTEARKFREELTAAIEEAEGDE